MRLDSKGRNARERYVFEFRAARKSRQCQHYRRREYNTVAVIVAARRMPRTIFRTARTYAPGIPVPSDGGFLRDVFQMQRRYGHGSALYRSCVRNFRAGLHVDCPFRAPLP